jgi:hypothetical protein
MLTIDGHANCPPLIDLAYVGVLQSRDGVYRGRPLAWMARFNDLYGGGGLSPGTAKTRTAGIKLRSGAIRPLIGPLLL